MDMETDSLIKRQVNSPKHSANKSRLIWDLLYHLCYRYMQARRLIPMIRHKFSPRIKLFGHPFELHGSHAGISEELSLYGIHEPEASRRYMSALEESDVVLDVGANIGYYCVMALHRLRRNGQLIALEPLPSNMEVLRSNLSLFKSVPIVILETAAGNYSGQGTFFESECPNWGSMVVRPSLRQIGECRVKVSRLDDIIATCGGRSPTVIRMDVEGFELEVLWGASGLLKERPFLFIEVHKFIIGQDGLHQLFETLFRWGYKRSCVISRIWDQPWIPRWARRRFSVEGTLFDILKQVNTNHEEWNVFSLFVGR